jgi:7,8-dihydropterin-6-yl-methyl-4-(beta-D-ribofuranosyl)aminobenzene 5'-phosphate synthase
MIKLMIAGCLVTAVAGLLLNAAADADSGTSRPSAKVFTIEPIGWVHKNEGSVWIEVDRRFEDALWGLDDYSHIWVFWWFDRNDTPSNRRILQVHPRGNARNPLTGVFATRAPVRPNLIALTLCQITSVEQIRIQIGRIDAFDGTPVVDLKPYLPALDRPVDVKVPDWVHQAGSAGEPATTPAIRPDEITLTIVYDNNKHDPRLETAWGFACVITGLEKTILFDTGSEGKILLANMRKLGIDPHAIDAVVLSHSHGDHTGGLDAFLRENRDVIVYALCSFPATIKHSVQQSGARLVGVDAPCEVCPGVRSTGEMGRAIKEQSLVIDTKTGVAVVTGCAHPGVARITRTAREISGTQLDLVLGGFHLNGASDQELKSIIADLKALGVKRAGPCHCSGERARQLFGEAFPAGFMPAGVGTQIRLERAPRTKGAPQKVGERPPK